jgi:hypothetical protein
VETRAIPGFQQQPASEPSRAWLYNAQNSNPRRDRPADAIEAGVGGFILETEWGTGGVAAAEAW